ncbi:hypothetical protein RB653_001356 [Dictyostelium firmibasis]|uniref:Protein acetyllysine N-acetyltransferase n=1 Tax=Dictyostelium firmibasis TaxID=79012 RepID=A0AAN7U886_9MYCE
MYAVNPIACKHLTEEYDSCINRSILNNKDLSNPRCHACNDESENWMCMTCGAVSCSRHVNGHAGEHYENTKHPISVSFSDHSFWCYTCDTYVHVNPLLSICQILEDIRSSSSSSSSSSSNKKDISVPKNNQDDEDDQVVPTSSLTTTTTTTISSQQTIVNNTTTATTSSSLSSTTTTTSTTTTVNNDKNEEESESESDESSSEGEESLTLIQRMKEMIFGVGRGPKIVEPSEQEEPEDEENVCVLKKPTIEEIAKYIKSGKCKNIIVMTGAGISVAAGIPDFRSPKTGLYEKLDKYDLPYREAIFDIEYFKKNPKPFYVLSKELFPGSFDPTTVHYFIKLLSDKGLLLRNFTQNIDTLERIAGIPGSKLVEAHGSFATSHCVSCKKEYSTDYVKEKIFKDELPECKETSGCKGIVKPDIVFFGESLPSRFNDCAREDFPKCDLLLVIGTSLKVHPFASLINFAKDIPRVLINFEEVGTNPYGGFKFNNPSNKLDVKCIGDCQSLVLDLIKLLGWENDFDQLIKK